MVRRSGFIRSRIVSNHEGAAKLACISIERSGALVLRDGRFAASSG